MASGTTKEKRSKTTRATVRLDLAGGASGTSATMRTAKLRANRPQRAAATRQRLKVDLGTASLVAGVSDDFSELPRDAQGTEISVALEGETYFSYIDWLADYLYRPALFGGEPDTLMVTQAWPPVSTIAAAIAVYLWQHPSAEYPPVRYRGIPRPIHADYIHRAELAKILSRVPRHRERRELLDRFYSQLAEDLKKSQ